jgi:hypothetical protein
MTRRCFISIVFFMAVVVTTNAQLSYGAKFGFLTGAYATLDLENRFFLSAEFAYSQKGVRTVGSTIRLHYVVLPLLIQYTIASKLKAEGGVELGYLVAAESEFGNANDVWDNRTDLGLDVGLSYEIGQMIVGTRFNAGLSSVIQNSGSVSGEKIRYQNRVITFSVAYPLGRRTF